MLDAIALLMPAGVMPRLLLSIYYAARPVNTLCCVLYAYYAATMIAARQRR